MDLSEKENLIKNNIKKSLDLIDSLPKATLEQISYVDNNLRELLLFLLEWDAVNINKSLIKYKGIKNKKIALHQLIDEYVTKINENEDIYNFPIMWSVDGKIAINYAIKSQKKAVMMPKNKSKRKKKRNTRKKEELIKENIKNSISLQVPSTKAQNQYIDNNLRKLLSYLLKWNAINVNKHLIKYKGMNKESALNQLINDYVAEIKKDNKIFNFPIMWFDDGITAINYLMKKDSTSLIGGKIKRYPIFYD